jgi:hypothetical protein
VNGPLASRSLLIEAVTRHGNTITEYRHEKCGHRLLLRCTAVWHARPPEFDDEPTLVGIIRPGGQ